MQFEDVLAALWRFKIVAVLVFVAFVVAGYVTAYSRPASYRASSILVAAPPNGDYNAIAGVQFMLPAIVQQVTTAEFKITVLKSLPAADRSTDVTIGATQDQGTGIIHVTATSHNPGALAAVSNAAAVQLIRSKLTSAVKLTLLQPASGATSISAGTRIPIVLAAGVLGLIAAVFVSLGANVIRRKVQLDDLKEFDLEVMGEIPKRELHSPLIKEAFDDPSLIYLSEAFHRLVANLQATGSFNTASRVAVVSCVGGEGKTTVTSGLAYALAVNGDHDVVVIDTDMRRPTLHTRFDLSQMKGQGGSASHTLPRKTALPNLRVVPAKISNEHPSKVVSRVLPQLLEQYRDSVVIVDTPPLLAVPEATFVAHAVGAVIVVVEPGRTERAVLDKTLHDLRRANVQVLGAVLNRMTRVTRAADTYFGYDRHVGVLRTQAAARRSQAAAKESGGAKR